jgi:uncharacterized protein (TIGR00369 family)
VPAAPPPRDQAFEVRVRASFARQSVMTTIGARLTRVTPGAVEIELPFRSDLTQQHGFVHAGVITTIADSACGYAAFSLMPAEASVLTVEYKVNLLAPARGDRFVARGRVMKPGRTLTVCAADVVAVTAAGETPVSTMLATLIALYDRPDLPPGV